MNIGGTISKLERNLDKIGMFVGGYSTLKAVGDAIGEDAFATGQILIEGLFSDPHIPDISRVIDALRNKAESKVFMPAAKAGVIGYFLKEIGLHPMLNRLGKAMMNGGFGIAKGTAIVTLINYSGASRSPIRTEFGGSSGGHSSVGKSETWRYQP